MVKRVNTTVRSVYHHVRSVSKISKCLDQETCAKVIHSVVASRLDYNNSLLIGLPAVLLKRMQLAQNHAARVVVQARKHEHVSPILQELHWLPVDARIKYKVLVFVYACLNVNKSPLYLCDLLSYQESSRSLRSSKDCTLLSVPRTRKCDGDRAFAASAPRLWNSIPSDIRESPSLSVFKRHLKTLLFKECYNL